MVAESVFEAGGLLRGSSGAALERYLARQRGVMRAEANPVSQTVTVAYDEQVLSADGVRDLIRAFGCTCGGEIVPCRLCRDEQAAVIGSTVEHGAGHPAPAPGTPPAEHAAHAAHAAAPAAGAEHAGHAEHAAHAAAPAAGAEHAGHAAMAASGEMAQMAHAMGHGAGM